MLARGVRMLEIIARLEFLMRLGVEMPEDEAEVFGRGQKRSQGVHGGSGDRGTVKNL